MAKLYPCAQRPEHVVDDHRFADDEQNHAGDAGNDVNGIDRLQIFKGLPQILSMKNRPDGEGKHHNQENCIKVLFDADFLQ